MIKTLVLCFLFAAVAHSAPQLEQEDLELELQALRTEIEFIKRTSTVLDLIQAEGYPVESHYVTTPDGYILNIHRIPHGKTDKRNGRVAFLQHGLLASSSDWVIAGDGKALAYMLANEGYDVWMGNFRGNRYSRNHTTLNPDKDADFWHFSWHEMGEIDLPTMIDHVLKHTGVDGVYHVGHSQGTTTFYVMGSVKPEYNKKIKAHVSLAPIAFMNHMASPLLKLVAAWQGPLSGLFEMIGLNEFLPSSKFLDFTSNFCSHGITQILCENSLFALCGFSPQEMNITLLATVMAHTPAGASTKQILHYGQGISSGFFRRFDFGWSKNKQIYGNLNPPEYNLQQVTTPVYLIYSRNDWLAAENDVEKLSNRLGNCKGKFLMSDYAFNHLDYTFGINAHKIVYPKVLGLFSRH